ncbi:MAG: ankyrin repeat domain-containing protein [Candidatus Velthaea sp.]
MWFVANNPILMKSMPPNIVDVARVMLDRGVEREDLDYTLELVTTRAAAREAGLQAPLMRLLLDAGATATRESVHATAAYRELAALRALLGRGYPLSAPLAAALDDPRLAQLLAVADRSDVQIAFGLAMINRHREAARLALEAGADVNAFMPVHAHMTALHQAAQDDDVSTIEFLLARGARLDIRDTIWNGTPLDWATHFDRKAARAALKRALTWDSL